MKKCLTEKLIEIRQQCEHERLDEEEVQPQKRRMFFIN